MEENWEDLSNGNCNKNGIVYQNGRLIKADVLIEGKKIKAIGIDLDAENVIDAQGMLVSPGLVDVHVHYRDPGQTYKEDIKTGSQAAARGGLQPSVQCQMLLRFLIHLN